MCGTRTVPLVNYNGAISSGGGGAIASGRVSIVHDPRTAQLHSCDGLIFIRAPAKTRHTTRQDPRASLPARVRNVVDMSRAM